jgi:hypothetical protein
MSEELDISLEELFALKKHYDKKSIEISLLIERKIERMKLVSDRD